MTRKKKLQLCDFILNPETPLLHGSVIERTLRGGIHAQLHGRAFCEGDFVDFFTDGSEKDGVAAWSVVCPTNARRSCTRLASGEQLAVRAEVEAFAHVLESTDGNVRVFTDCPTVMEAARSIHAPDRRVRRSLFRCRDILERIMVAADGRCVEIVKVKGHTEGTDLASRWNAEADARAYDLVCRTTEGNIRHKPVT